MTCREFGRVAVELARGRGATGEMAAKAAAHAAECAGCAERLARERAVTDALAELAASARGRGAPAHVEKALVEAFARRPNARGAERMHWARWATAAALVMAVVGISAWLREPRVVEAPAVPRPAPQAAAAIPKRVMIAPAAAPKVARIRPARARTGRPATPKREVATRFYPLRDPGRDVDMARGTVLRVQVPRTTLVSFGLPIDQDRASEPVQADLVLDEIGMARAIRFVRQQ